MKLIEQLGDLSRGELTVSQSICDPLDDLGSPRVLRGSSTERGGKYIEVLGDVLYQSIYECGAGVDGARVDSEHQV